MSSATSNPKHRHIIFQPTVEDRLQRIKMRLGMPTVTAVIANSLALIDILSRAEEEGCEIILRKENGSEQHFTTRLRTH